MSVSPSDVTVVASNASREQAQLPSYILEVVHDLAVESNSQDERVEKLELVCARLIGFMCESINRTDALTKRNNTLTHHVNVLRKSVNHLEKMCAEIELLRTQLNELRRVRGAESVVYEAVLCDHNI